MRLTPDKKLHSREHVLAEDLSLALSEPKRFAAYLGIAKRYDESDLRALARYAVEKKDLPVEARGKYFFASLKGLIKKPMEIVKEPEKVLRKKAADVPIADIAKPRTQDLIKAMKETLRHTPDGVGLAAPQIGESLRVFIVSEEAEEIDRAQKAGWKRRKAESLEKKENEPYEKRAWKYHVFINPVVKKVSRKMLEDAEGCLSVPKKYGLVMRHEKITVEAHDEHGKKITRGSSRFFARVMQHELDHLEGTLFIDKMKSEIKQA